MAYYISNALVIIAWSINLLTIIGLPYIFKEEVRTKNSPYHVYWDLYMREILSSNPKVNKRLLRVLVTLTVPLPALAALFSLAYCKVRTK